MFHHRLVRPHVGLIALVWATTLLAATPHVFAATHHVPGEFATIQEALDAAAPRDTVRIASGDYIESVEVREDSLTILGAGPLATRIRGFSGSTITIQTPSDEVVIRDLGLRPAPGIVTTLHALPGSTSELSGLLIEGGTIGLRAQDAGLLLEDSIIRDCTIGVSADLGNSPRFLGNSITDNLLTISVSSGAEPVFHGNRFERSGLAHLQVSSYSAAATIDVLGNWWGTADESTLVSTIRRDASAEHVEIRYVPWCADPGCLALGTQPVTWGALRVLFHHPKGSEPPRPWTPRKAFP